MMMAAMIPAKSAISPQVTALRVLVIPTLPKYHRLPGRAGDPEQGGGAAHGRAGYLPRRGRGLRG